MDETVYQFIPCCSVGALLRKPQRLSLYACHLEELSLVSFRGWLDFHLYRFKPVLHLWC